MYRNTDTVESDDEVLEEYRKLLETRVIRQTPVENQTQPSSSRAPLIRNSVLDLENQKIQQAAEMQADQIASMEAAIAGALQRQEEIFEAKLSKIMGELSLLKGKTPSIQTFQEIEYKPEEVPCNEPLDMVKSVPEFDGKQENYVSWRQAATAAYKIFATYPGSSRHYQAVGILKNKVRGPAAAVLASFNTPLNFHAILARLDFTYADKTPTHVIKQELSLSRQGELPLLKYYDEIERKLTLLTNKTIMTHDEAAAAVLNEQHREDALHAFVSGFSPIVKNCRFSGTTSRLTLSFGISPRSRVE